MADTSTAPPGQPSAAAPPDRPTTPSGRSASRSAAIVVLAIYQFVLPQLNDGVNSFVTAGCR